jgi:hypothetical protein
MAENSLTASFNLAGQQFRKLGFEPQATYNPIIRDTFYQLVPHDFKFYYYNNIRRVLYWYQGYVPEVHRPTVGIMATGIGNSIVKEVSKLIIGGRVFYRNKGKEVENDSKQLNKTLNIFEKWSDRYKFQNTIKRLVEYSVAGGTSALVSYVNDKSDIHYLPYRIDQFFYYADITGNPYKFYGFLGNYTAKLFRGEGRDYLEENFYLLEERYYNDNGEPVKKFVIKKATGNVTTAKSFDISNTQYMDWEQLPKDIRKRLKTDFKDIKIGVEQPIKHCKDLGVYIFRFTTTNRVPEIDMGESVLLNVIKYMIDYEYAESALDTDMYIGRGKVYIPAMTKNPTDDARDGYYSGFDSMVFERMPMRSIEDQKPISVQFDLRADDWVKTRNNISEKIASTIGVGGSDIFSYLKDATGAAKTATQIADESRKTLSFVEEKREIFISEFDKVLKDWIGFYNYEDEIKIKFSSQNLVNKLVTLDETRVLKEIGLSSFDLFKQIYPDKDDDQIQEMVDRKFTEMKRIKEINVSVENDQFEQRMLKINGRKEGSGINETKTTEEKGDIDKGQEKTKENEVISKANSNIVG